MVHDDWHGGSEAALRDRSDEYGIGHRTNWIYASGWQFGTKENNDGPQRGLGGRGGRVEEVELLCDGCGRPIVRPEDGVSVRSRDPKGGPEDVTVLFLHERPCLAAQLLVAWAHPDQVVIRRLAEHVKGVQDFFARQVW